ncbi:MAG: PadR family transcriptional regulator [Gaiellales bacterium]
MQREVLLLSVVEEQPLHGYAIIGELKRRSGGTFDLKEGTIYPALHRLERSGLLTSREVRDQGPRPRRVYRLTAKGERAIHTRTDAWQEFQTAMGQVLDRPRWQT